MASNKSNKCVISVNLEQPSMEWLDCSETQRPVYIEYREKDTIRSNASFVVHPQMPPRVKTLDEKWLEVMEQV